MESAVDCVLGVYGDTAGGSGTTLADLVLLDDDDDSGTGNWPELTVPLVSIGAPYFGAYWIAVDSKTEGDFTLKFQLQHIGTPPGNDNFASATVIGSIPYTASGSTVSATAEPNEREAQGLGAGPKDSVWYKYVATFNGTLKIKATCNTANDDAYVYVDAWHGTALDTITRNPDPPPLDLRGFFGHFDTALQLDSEAIAVDVVSGQTYYIRVQTESGGSEDFTIYIESQAVNIDIQASGIDEMHGTLLDAATPYVDIQISGTDIYHLSAATDAATVPIDIQVASVDIAAKEYTDLATVYYNISIDSHDCQTTWGPDQLSARCYRRLEATSLGRWNGTQCYRRFEVIAGDGLEEC